MKEMPEVIALEDGTKAWQQEFESFRVKVIVPVTEQPGEIVNFGFRAPYLMIFEEKERSLQEAKAFAEEAGFAKIAARFAGSVVFFYPTCEGGWKNAGEDLFAQIIAQSRISQYYKDGAAIMYDRFAKKMGDAFIRGAVLRTYLYGFGESADFIAKNCLKTIEGDGLYGKGDITPAGCILQGLSVVPSPERRDIPVVSVGNRKEINDVLEKSLDYVLIKDTADYEKDFESFTGTFRRMMGNLEKEADLEAMGMAWEPSYCMVKTSPDNQGDDKDTTEHPIGYVAYYNKALVDKKEKMPLVLCFHGGGDSAMCMSSVSGWYRVAADYNFLLICVENHLNSTATETMELIEHLKGKYNIDTQRIYASGFSMGGCKSWDMFQEYPKVFAAVAPMDATFEVGLNSSGQPAPCEINRDTVLPVFYVGGEITPLPELPFQAQKCLDRMAYVLKVNGAVKQNTVAFDKQDTWENPIWGINGDRIVKLDDPERENSTLTLHYFDSEDGNCYCVFGSVSNQAHEVRHHSCEEAWKYMSQFHR